MECVDGQVRGPSRRGAEEDLVGRGENAVASQTDGHPARGSARGEKGHGTETGTGPTENQGASAAGQCD